MNKSLITKNPAPQTPVSQTPDLEGLREFATETGRVDPPVFVGRGEFIREFQRDIQTRTRKWYDGKPGPWKGGSWLFQGAPGAGKTALLRELKKITVPNSVGLYKNPEVCMLKKEALNSDTKLESELLSLFPGNWLGDLIREIGLRLSLFGGGGEISAEKQAATKAWRRKVKKAMNNPGAFRPLLVMIDEAQEIEDKARAQLGWLHEGTHGLPILPVFGGLAWTRKRFKKLGLSRIDGNRAITLKRLPRNNCLEAVRRFFEKYRVIASPQAKEKWAQAIADDCMGWPQHLHFSLQGMALALIAPGVDGNLDRLDEKDLATARQYAKEQRNDYYSDRLDSDSLKGKRYLTAAAAERLARNPKMTEDELGVEIEKIHSLGVSRKFIRSCLPEGLSGEKFAQGMTHAGILQEDGDGYLSVPIPCFHNYLIEKLEQWERNRNLPSEPKENPAPGF